MNKKQQTEVICFLKELEIFFDNVYEATQWYTDLSNLLINRGADTQGNMIEDIEWLLSYEEIKSLLNQTKEIASGKTGIKFDIRQKKVTKIRTM